EHVLPVQEVVDVLVDPARLDHIVAAFAEALQRGGDLLVGHHVLDVVQSLALLVEVTPVDVRALDRLNQFELHVALPRHRADELERLLHTLPVDVKVAHRLVREVAHVPRPDPEQRPVPLHRLLHVADDERDLPVVCHYPSPFADAIHRSRTRTFASAVRPSGNDSSAFEVVSTVSPGREYAVARTDSGSARSSSRDMFTA